MEVLQVPLLANSWEMRSHRMGPLTVFLMYSFTMRVNDSFSSAVQV